MRKLRPYIFRKVFNEDQVFENHEYEIKLGYLNINGILDAHHYEYLMQHLQYPERRGVF